LLKFDVPVDTLRHFTKSGWHTSSFYLLLSC